MARQLTFELPVTVRIGENDFFVSDANAVAYAMLGDPATWPNAKLALVGPAGSGKTHLAGVFSSKTGADVLAAKDIRADTALPTEALVIEDGEHLSEAAEEWLFHAHNHLAREGHPLLLTSRTSPARWDVKLPDLASRLSAITTVTIEDPDDPLLTAVLMKHFQDRQLVPAPDAVTYLITQLPRSFEAVRDTVDALDTAALAQGKALTRPFVRKVLDSL